MKKTLLSLTIFSLIFAFGNISSAKEMEKISSPDQIKFFQEVKKEGTSLFGIRKIQKEKEQIKISNQKINNNVTTSLEKISSPTEMPLFNKIIKKGAELWGVRKEVKIQKTPNLIAANLAPCVKAALDQKDESLKTSITSHGQKMISAITSRNECQKNSLDKLSATEQVASNKACLENFQKELKKITENTNQERKLAQEKQKADLRACLPAKELNQNYQESENREIKLENEVEITELNNESLE